MSQLGARAEGNSSQATVTATTRLSYQDLMIDAVVDGQTFVGNADETQELTASVMATATDTGANIDGSFDFRRTVLIGWTSGGEEHEVKIEVRLAGDMSGDETGVSVTVTGSTVVVTVDGVKYKGTVDDFLAEFGQDLNVDNGDFSMVPVAP